RHERRAGGRGGVGGPGEPGGRVHALARDVERDRGRVPGAVRGAAHHDVEGRRAPARAQDARARVPGSREPGGPARGGGVMLTSVIRKELRGYFNSAIAVIFLAAFLAVTLYTFFWR